MYPDFPPADVVMEAVSLLETPEGHAYITLQGCDLVYWDVFRDSDGVITVDRFVKDETPAV